MLRPCHFLAKLQSLHGPDLYALDAADRGCDLVQILLDDRKKGALHPLQVTDDAGDVFTGLLEQFAIFCSSRIILGLRL